jgi:hypothetical protein
MPTKHAFFSGCNCKTEVLQLPHGNNYGNKPNKPVIERVNETDPPSIWNSALSLKAAEHRRKYAEKAIGKLK